MNTTSASAPPGRHPPQLVAAPKDHANRSPRQDADFPTWRDWLAGVGLAAFFLFAPQVLGRFLRMAL